MVLCITDWIESEPNHPFITPTNNWNQTWFGSHILWNKTIIIIFCVLTIGVTILASTIEIQLVLYSQCNVGSPVWIS